jgi:hypothetical protein
MKNLKLIALLLINFSIFSQTFWNQLEGPYGSNASPYFAVDSSGKIYFVSTDLYCSTNNGDNWNKINMPYSYERAIAFHPNGSIFLSADERIYRSTNNGNNWEMLLHTYYYEVNNFLIKIIRYFAQWYFIHGFIMGRFVSFN